jgi:predicted MFS family arabinose efflux permease
MTAMGCFALASLAAGTATGYGGLMLAASLAGIGNCPFHPADFTVLNQRVSPKRLAHAFSVHGVSGSLGWAATPVLLIAVEQASGNWRLAYAATALLALAVMGTLWWGREAIGGERGKPARAPDAAAAEHPLAFLRLPSVWLCFSFFFWSTAALSAIQSFAGPALALVYGMAPALAALVVTGYLLCGAAGIIAGGFVASGGQKLERNIAICLALAAALLLAVGSGSVPPLLAAVLTAAAGFGTGLAGPSRDMLIRRAAPPGATGRVYGAVYSGLDVGFALAAPVFGALLDRGMPRGIFLGAALTLMMGIASAALVAAATRTRSTVTA